MGLREDIERLTLVKRRQRSALATKHAAVIRHIRKQLDDAYIQYEITLQAPGHVSLRAIALDQRGKPIQIVISITNGDLSVSTADIAKRELNCKQALLLIAETIADHQ